MWLLSDIHRRGCTDPASDFPARAMNKALQAVKLWPVEWPDAALMIKGCKTCNVCNSRNTSRDTDAWHRLMNLKRKVRMGVGGME